MALGAVLTPTVTIPTGTGSWVTGDVMASQMTLAGAVSSAAGSGVIEKAMVFDNNANLLAFDLYLYSATVTLAADSAAWAPSDADNALCVATVKFPAPEQNSLNRLGYVATSENINCAATSLFITMVARSTMATAITAATVKFAFWIRQDQ
jgi:hypothetical protein